MKTINLLKITKNDFFNKMRNRGIILQVHYIPVHTQPFYKKNFDFKIGDFPLSENFYKNEVSIFQRPQKMRATLRFDKFLTRAEEG